MNDTSKFNAVVSFLWSIADLLNGAFKKSEFQKIILPFTVLRRLDYALEKTKDKVLEGRALSQRAGPWQPPRPALPRGGICFLRQLGYHRASDDTVASRYALRNLRQYVMGFSPNVREIFAAFNFDDSIRDLDRVNLLYLLMERFNEKSRDRPSPLPALTEPRDGLCL